MRNGTDKGQKLAKAALAKSNTVSFTVEGTYENDRQRFLAMAQDLGITFDANNNVASNTIKSDTADNTSHSEITTGNPHNIGIEDIPNLQTELDSKQDTITGFTGTIDVITGVDFTEETTTVSTITVTNGIITSVS